MTSCGIKTEFDENESSWLNVYNEGDTLIFKSEDNVFDTTFIIQKEIYYPNYNPVELHGKYLPKHGIIWYRNSQLIHSPEGDKLLSLIKKEPSGKTSLTISYKYSHFIVLNIDKLNQYFHDGLYEFEASNSEVDSLKPKKIFWHEKRGITKYVTGNNVTWKKIDKE